MCSSGCPTPGLHESFGACLRAKKLQIENPAARKHDQKVNSDLNSYREARAAGIQPASIWKKDVENAWRISDAIGTPYRADK